MGRRIVAGIGRTFIAAGVLLLLFVAYQLWGTGIETAREQRSLSKAFDQRLAELGVTLGDPTAAPAATAPPTPVVTTAAPTTASPATAAPATAAPTTAPTVAAPATSASPPTSASATAAPPTRPASGEVRSRDRRTRRVEARAGELVARIKIPAIGVDDIVVGGVKKTDLKKGPGHYPGTPLPGSPGNAAIAGHRTTYGAPFFRLNELRPGDDVFVATVATGQWFRYRVTRQEIVGPHENRVLLPTPGRNTLTLTTCHPRYSAAKRLILTAELVGEAVEQDFSYIGDTAADTGPDTIDTTPATTATPTPTTSTPGQSTVAFDEPDASVSPDPGAAGTVAPDAAAADAVATETGLDALDPGAEELTLDGRAGSGATVKVWWLRGTTEQWRGLGVWSSVCAAIALAIWLLARGRRKLFVRWGIYAAGTVVVFLPALYVAFEHLSRLLPENV